MHPPTCVVCYQSSGVIRVDNKASKIYGSTGESFLLITDTGPFMNRFTSFLAGMVVGATGLFVSMNYYVVRASDGTHFVPKIAAKIEFPYYDIRNYDLQDWQNHQALALALVKAKKSDVLQGSSFDSFRRQAEDLLGRISQ